MVDILAIGAHPDDIEFGVGGILAKMASQNKSIVMADLTLGELATNGTPAIRMQEATKAADLIGAKRVFLDFKDCQIRDDFEGRLKLVALIREYKPKLVIAPMWKGEMNHPDHLACGNLARAACRYARFSKILPELPIHRPEGILHYICRDKVDFLIDITSHIDAWKEMMNCHQSQLKTMDYIGRNISQAGAWGEMIGKPYAQALVKGNPIEIEDLMHISKGTMEV